MKQTKKNDPSIKIYVACHKPDDYMLKINNPMFIPIHCGKAIYDPSQWKSGYLPELGDNTGDNISQYNKCYCELTALYWIWKNDKSRPEDIVGLNHYRRYFSEPGSNDDKFITRKTILELLSENEFIVSGSGSQYNEECNPEDTMYVSYARDHVVSDLDNALIAIKQLYPEWYDRIYREVTKTNSMCLCNMMICKKEQLDAYCEYLFPILKYVMSKIDFSDGIHTQYNARACGFLGERLFRPWIMVTGRKAIAAPELDWEKYSGYVWT